EAFDWQHGVFLGATLSSEKTAAAVGRLGEVRRDPMAMLPFIGYHAGDYVQHWLNIGKQADASKLPKIFYVNWFRRGGNQRYLWPGFGDNSRVLKWVIERIEGRAAAVDTAVGRVPTPDQLDLSGLNIAAEDITAALKVDIEEWRAEIPLIEQWFAKIGPTLPTLLTDELTTLKHRLLPPLPASSGLSGVIQRD
ncbi:MAG: phosphoenolpyruvate carboxykinase domain-containing protein, partial [Pseudonocardiaceae bacterium]